MPPEIRLHPSQDRWRAGGHLVCECLTCGKVILHSPQVYRVRCDCGASEPLSVVTGACVQEAEPLPFVDPT